MNDFKYFRQSSKSKKCPHLSYFCAHKISTLFSLLSPNSIKIKKEKQKKRGTKRGERWTRAPAGHPKELEESWSWKLIDFAHCLNTSCKAWLILSKLYIDKQIRPNRKIKSHFNYKMICFLRHMNEKTKTPVYTKHFSFFLIFPTTKNMKHPISNYHIFVVHFGPR